jgi:hypothetical protein
MVEDFEGVKVGARERDHRRVNPSVRWGEVAGDCWSSIIEQDRWRHVFCLCLFDRHT